MKLHQIVEAKSTLASLTGYELAADLISQFADTDIHKVANNSTEKGFVTRVEVSSESGLQTKLEAAIMRFGFNVKSPAGADGINYFPAKGSKSLIQLVNMKADKGTVVIRIDSFKDATNIDHAGGKDGIVK